MDRLLLSQEERNASGAIIVSNARQRRAVVHSSISGWACSPAARAPAKLPPPRLFGLHCCLNPDLGAEDFLICAPTGKAANRLKQSLDRALQRSIEPKNGPF